MNDGDVRKIKKELKASIEKRFFEGSSESLHVFENKLHVTTTAIDPKYKVSVFPHEVKYQVKRWIVSGRKEEL